MLRLFHPSRANGVRKWAPHGQVRTPYKRAGQEWDDRMGSALVQAYHWRLACFTLIAAFALQTAGIIYLGSLPKAATHVVEVDRLGAARYFGPVATASYKPGPDSIKYYLRQFVHHTRTLTSDADVLKTWWVVVFKFLTPAANASLTEWVKANNPFQRAADLRVGVDFSAVIPLSSDTWQIDWRELIADKDGTPISSHDWRATMRVSLRTLDPENDDQIDENPLGIFIDEFHWTRLP
jgi:type IV secretory pathway TrbF-like protein